MNLGEMETLLKRYGFDSKDPLKEWLNAALHEFESERDWPFLEAVPVEQEMGAGENTITLPASTLKVITLKDETNIYKLQYYDWHKFERDIREPTERGKPELYTLKGLNEIQIWRVLESATKFMVQVQLVAPDLAIAGDEPKTAAGRVWPKMCHFPIVQRAASIALQAENEEERAKTAQAEYEKALMTIAMKFTERELDEPTTVEDVQGYGQTFPYAWQSV